MALLLIDICPLINSALLISSRLLIRSYHLTYSPGLKAFCGLERFSFVWKVDLILLVWVCTMLWKAFGCREKRQKDPELRLAVALSKGLGFSVEVTWVFKKKNYFHSFPTEDQKGRLPLLCLMTFKRNFFLLYIFLLIKDSGSKCKGCARLLIYQIQKYFSFFPLGLITLALHVNTQQLFG